DRINQPLSFSSGVGAYYKYWLKPGFGIGTGVEMHQYQSQVKLDKLDSFFGKDPHLSDVKFNTNLYQINWPVTALFKTQSSERIGWYTNVGLILSYRFWEDFESSAIQTQLGREVGPVISDSNWESDLSSFFIGAEVDAGISIKLSRHIIVQAGANVMTGLSPIDKNSDQSFYTNKYAGQHNPLWMDPDSRNFVRFAGLKVGFSYILGKYDTNK
ncbi:MAG: outer membrane beta-barrel protein, partial [Bacteroidales bacterium]|nr:outer membrane beta-barrel protein [Bacteroidales bacterium]